MSEGYSVGSALNGSGHYPRTGSIDVIEEDPRSSFWWAWLIVGIVVGALGLLPWLLSGMALPVQKLWATHTSASDMPLALLPLGKNGLGDVVVMFLAGSAIAGFVGRLARTKLTQGGFWALLAGVVLVQAVATAQAAFVLQAGVKHRIESTAYLSVIVLVALVAIIAGAGILALIARAPRAGALLGFALAALPFSEWLASYTTLTSLSRMQLIGTEIDAWLPAVIIAAAIGWSGMDTVGRIIAALVALALVWIAPAINVAIGAVAASHALSSAPSVLARHGVAAFQSTLFEFSVLLPPLVLTVVVAAVVLLLRLAVSRTRRGRMPRVAVEY
ncbi:hypothetical protein HII28_05705 [Planctomonas sp. JC2975]|uniref:hypothetical protein n=1 Tax=Planctomonas sp. JC2975 TaxID=2729626 RepID=UPI0014763303|nr:hypothetical protein [Planctomonas sp. JC2975]NNC11372.1 hypothetical protein [Planctomonas sp. JC2975]